MSVLQMVFTVFVYGLDNAARFGSSWSRSSLAWFVSLDWTFLVTVTGFYLGFGELMLRRQVRRWSR